MSGHTPGPWRYAGHGGTHVLDSNGRCIGDAPQPHGMPPEEGEANARLIAAAPEMLEALMSAVGSLEACAEEFRRRNLREEDLALESIEVVRSAIAKAERGAR